MPSDSQIRPPFTVPAPGANTVARESVLANLDQVLSRKLAVLHAPAGYGKTTLLSLFCERVAPTVSPVYLTLDQADRAPARFLRLMLNAISNAGVTLRENHSRPGDGLKESNYKKVLENACAQVASSGRQIVLMLDDFFEAENEETIQIIEHLINVQPANLHLVIASRLLPKLPLATLNLRKEAVIIDVDQMRFDQSEMFQLLQSLPNLELSDEDIATLAEKTEGWPIALQLIRIWQKEGKVSADELMKLSGKTVEIADYLLEQVFDRLSEKEKQFAVSTSILKRLNGDIANAVCGRSDCWKILRDFEANGLFVVPLDNRRSWYRYHTLFKEFLQQRLAWEGESHIASCHVAAARWLIRHDSDDEAMHHFLAANESEQAAALAEELGGWRLIWNGQTTLLQTVCDAVDQSIIDRHPRLRLGQIYLTARNDDVQKALAELDDLKRQHARNASAMPALATEMRTIEVVLAGYADRPLAQTEIAELEIAVDEGEHLDVTLLAMIYNFLCLRYLEDSRFNRSRTAADQAIVYYRAGNFDFAVDVVRVHVAQSLLAEGRLSDAAVLCDMLVDESLSLLDETQAVYRIIAAEIAVERNELQRAASLLEDTVPFLEDFGSWVNIYTSMYKSAATVARVECGSDAAMQVLEKAKATAAKRQLPRLGLFADLLIVQELLSSGLAGKASRHAERSRCFDAGQPHHDRLRWQLGEDIKALQARLLLAQGHTAQAQQLIRQLPLEFAPGSCRRQIIDNLLLSSVMYRQDNNAKAELRALDAALSAADEERFERVILDAGLDIPARILALAAKTDSPLNRHSVLRRIRQACSTRSSRAFPPIGEPAIKLTPRELDVLAGIGLGLSSPQIAAKLGLSENTVNHHRKNVYCKLEISSRSEAAAYARRMKLTGDRLT